MYECLWGRELLMENICVASKTERGLVRVCLLCLSVCSPPALVIVLLGVSGVLWFLLLLLSSNLARVFVSRVAWFAVWSEAARVVTNGFEGTQAHILAWRPFFRVNLRRGKGLQHRQWEKHAWTHSDGISVPAFTASKAQTRRTESRGKGLLFGLAISFVNAHKGCTWMPKLVSDGLISIRLCGWIPFGK